MINFLRKFVLIIAASAFLLASVNAFLFIHLSEHKTDTHHDHNKCPICQQAAINKTKFILPTVETSPQPTQITIVKVNAIEYFVKDFRFITPYLRAPPTIA